MFFYELIIQSDYLKMLTFPLFIYLFLDLFIYLFIYKNGDESYGHCLNIVYFLGFSKESVTRLAISLHHQK